MNINSILAELRAERDRINRAISANRRSGFYRTREGRASAKGGGYPEDGRAHERGRPEEAVAAAEAALGAGEDEAEGEGEIGRA